jgi:lipoprotein-releasing system ATP-binding protein
VKGIKVKNLIKEFGKPPVRIIHEMNLKIERGEFVSISGRSGSGKSTLLYLLSTLDQPSSGEVEIDGKNVSRMSVQEVHRFRNQDLGFVFQFHYLLPELNALENVLLPARKGRLEEQKKSKALELLTEFGIEGKEKSYPSQLSGGEQQRVAIARALIMNPNYVFADEPTGNLDTRNGIRVMNILKKVNEEQGATLILVTHELSFSRMADREIYLVDGEVSSREEDDLF